MALLALYEVLKRNNVEKAKTLSLSLLAFQSEIEEKLRSKLLRQSLSRLRVTLDRQVISDDYAFDKVPGLKRIPLSPKIS
jgi:hypothetical protein